MTDYPFRPDHVDPGVTAMHTDRRALVSQIPRSPMPPRDEHYLEQVAEARAEDRRNYTPPLRGFDALLAKRNREWVIEHARTRREDRRTA